MADIAAHAAGADVGRDQSAYARNQYLESLPGHAQVKYRQYIERKSEAEALLRHLRERGEELGQKLHLMQHNLGAGRQRNGAVDYYEKQTSAAQAEHDALTAKRSKLDAQHGVLAGIMNALNAWLFAQSNGMAHGPRYDSTAETPRAALHEGENFLTAIRRVQDETMAVNLQLAQVRSAPPPAKELREMIVTQLAGLRSANFGHRWVTNPITGVEELKLVAPDLVDWAAATNPSGLITGYLLNLFPERMIELFIAGVRDDAVGVSRSLKPQLIAELEAQIVDLELQEMAYIEAAQAAGLDLLPRASMNPLALLGLCPVHPAHAQPELMQAAE